MTYFVLRGDTFRLRDKRGQIIYERLIQKPLHHVRYTELKKGYCVKEYAIDEEPKGCLANFFFAFRGSRKINEFILPI